MRADKIPKETEQIGQHKVNRTEAQREITGPNLKSVIQI